MMFADERTAQTSCCAAPCIPAIPLPPQPFCSLAAVLPPSVYLPWFIVLFAVPLLQQAPAIWNANIRPSEMGMRSPSFVWISDDKSQRKEQGSQSVCVWPQCGQIQLLKLWVHAHRFAVFALILGPLTPEIAAHLAPVSRRFAAEWQTKPWWSRSNWTNIHPNTLRCTRVFRGSSTACPRSTNDSTLCPSRFYYWDVLLFIHHGPLGDAGWQEAEVAPARPSPQPSVKTNAAPTPLHLFPPSFYLCCPSVFLPLVGYARDGLK